MPLTNARRCAVMRQAIPHLFAPTLRLAHCRTDTDYVQQLTRTIERGTSLGVSSDDVLYANERTRVVRRKTPAGSVILKHALGIDATVRAQHEIAMLERLANATGVAKLAPASARGAADATVIALHDDRGTPLSSALARGRLAVDEVLELALRLARAVAHVHEAGIVHRDVNPTNVLLVGPAREPLLIDFHLASCSVDERPAFAAHDKIEGTLPYIAPEQTGRTGRTVDERADLYSLGATLYEAATGDPPFGRGNAFDLIRDHLVRKPVPPCEREPALPAAFSAILLRLLEKEPDRRYLSAHGLVHDLAFLIAERAAGRSCDFALGRRDFPMRLLPPSRLVGRDRERAELEAAFETARIEGNGVLVSGAPGVGKSALIDELRATTTAHAGLFVRGKFDQYRQDVDSDAVLRAFRTLAVLLLAESEETLAPLRRRIVATVGPDLAFLSTVIPEFGALMSAGGESATVEPIEGRTRLVALVLTILRCVASPERPVVFVVDDVQWAPETSLNFLDALIDGQRVPGLLLVIAYRASEVDAAHPLAALRAKWRRIAAPPCELFLADLDASDLATLLGDMLSLPAAGAAHLARAVATRTHGNPFDTVELINALRKDAILVPGDDGWQWDPRSIRQHIGRGDVIELLAARIDALPEETAAVLEVIACLGGEVSRAILAQATGLDERALESRCGPAFADGLILSDRSIGETIRFRHDRVQQAAYGRSSLAARARAQLAIARRLAERIDARELAAEQYTRAIGSVVDPREARDVVTLLRGAAAQQASITNYSDSERYLSAARELSHRLLGHEVQLILQLEAELHNVYYQLGRLEAADVVFARIEGYDVRSPATLQAACRQISSLTNRHAHSKALALGMRLLERAGRRPFDAGDAVPTEAELLARVAAWSDAAARPNDARGEPGDTRAVEVATILAPMMPPAFFTDRRVLRWLVLESMDLWIEHGPQRGLVGPLLHVSQLGIPNAASYRVGQLVIDASAARGYEPETSRARYLFALALQQWFEPFDDCLASSRAAYEGLVRGGDLHNACFTLNATIVLLFDGSETVDEFLEEVQAAIAFSVRTGNAPSNAVFQVWRQFARACRGETRAPGSFDDEGFDEAAFAAAAARDLVTSGYYHVARAASAALADDAERLVEHAALAMPSLPHIANIGWTVAAYFVQAIALARRIQRGDADEDGTLLRELARCRDWLDARSYDNPAAFAHLVALIDAERAWALGDVSAACDAFELALRDAPLRRSPRHAALVAERAARFHLSRGREHYGRLLLAESRASYARWRAFGKLRQLDESFPFLKHSGQAISSVRSTSVSSQDMDIVAILRASQALSSQTNLARLEAEVRTLLAELTGATDVALLLYDDGGWYDGGVRVEGALHPNVALRYVARTRAPLVVADIARDERVARDPYFNGGRHASLLVVPIAIAGELRAAVVLENREQREAFSASRLDAVTLIAGQLAISIENARLYASLERKVDERTAALTFANDTLALLSNTDPLTGLANRRRFDEHYAALLESCARDARPVALIMLDIDEFKRYNDYYGHPAGDACLRLVAATLATGTRPGSDLVARYGGEEFLIVLTDTDAERALQVAERLRCALAEVREPHAASRSGFVTASFGVASFRPAADTDGAAWIRAVDIALYHAKHGGRNRVVESSYRA